MTIIEEYKKKHRRKVIELFMEFQDFLSSIDPLKRLRANQGYGEFAVQNILREIKTKKGKFFLAFDNKTVIGFVSGTIPKPTKDSILQSSPAKFGRITELYVVKEYRGQGVGSALIQRIENYFKDHEVEYIKLEVFAPNESAREFYSKMGYSERDVDLIKKLL